MLIVHLFVSYAHVNLSLFLFLLVSGFGCGFCLWLFLDFSVYLFFNKSGSMLSQSEGQMLIDIMNDHGLEQLVHFPTREKNTLLFLVNSKKYIPQTNLVIMTSSQEL